MLVIASGTPNPLEPAHSNEHFMFNDTDIRKYQKLHKRYFGEDISRKEALEKGTNLLRLMELIFKPMNESEYKQVQERRNETKSL